MKRDRLNWKDATSYSRDRERLPTCWSTDFAGLHLTVLTGHRDDPDHWVMHCEPWFKTKAIAPKTLETYAAQDLAVEIVAKKLRSALAVLEGE